MNKYLVIGYKMGQNRGRLDTHTNVKTELIEASEIENYYGVESYPNPDGKKCLEYRKVLPEVYDIERISNEQVQDMIERVNKDKEKARTEKEYEKYLKLKEKYDKK